MTPRSNQMQRAKQCVLLGSLVLAAGMLEGCYERTVRAEGFGASGVKIQKPYVKNRWGQSETEFKKMNVKPAKKSSKPW